MLIYWWVTVFDVPNLPHGTSTTPQIHWKKTWVEDHGIGELWSNPQPLKMGMKGLGLWILFYICVWENVREVNQWGYDGIYIYACNEDM